MAVLIASDGGEAKRLESSEFEVEKSMRDMLLRHPDMIPVYEIDEDIRLLTIKRELRVFEAESDKFADAVAVDKNGSIYLIETKLFRNPDKRQVVAQVLSYGASLWSSSQSSNEFMDIMNESCLDLFNKPFLELVKEFFSIGNDELESLKDTMRKNWDDGIFKFVVYMDKVGDDLKNLVTYVNKRSRFDLYLVGVDYYKKDGIEIIIPKLYGVPDRKEVEPHLSKRAKRVGGITESEYLSSAKERLGDHYGNFNRFFEFLRDTSGDVSSFRENTRFGGSYTPKFPQLKDSGPFSLKADSTLQIYLNYLDAKELLDESNRIHEFLVESGLMSKDETSRQPYLNPNAWIPRMNEIMGTINELIREDRRLGPNREV